MGADHADRQIGQQESALRTCSHGHDRHLVHLPEDFTLGASGGMPATSLLRFVLTLAKVVCQARPQSFTPVGNWTLPHVVLVWGQLLSLAEEEVDTTAKL